MRTATVPRMFIAAILAIGSGFVAVVLAQQNWPFPGSFSILWIAWTLWELAVFVVLTRKYRDRRRQERKDKDLMALVTATKEPPRLRAVLPLRVNGKASIN